MLKNGQTYFEDLAAFTPQNLLKYVWPFFNIMHKRVNLILTFPISRQSQLISFLFTNTKCILRRAETLAVIGSC